MPASSTTAIPPLARRDWQGTRFAQRIGPQPRNARRSPPETTCIDLVDMAQSRIAPVLLIVKILYAVHDLQPILWQGVRVATIGEQTHGIVTAYIPS